MSDKIQMNMAWRSIILAGVMTTLFALTVTSIARPGMSGGGFLYSDYIVQPTAGSLEDSFTVSAGGGYWDGAITRARGGFRDISIGDYLLEEHVNDGGSAIERTYSELSSLGWRMGADMLEEGAFGILDGGRVRHLDIGIETESGSGFSNASIDAIGSLHETERGALSWQARGYTGFNDRYGLNFGWMYRHAQEESLLGANIFLDYETYESNGYFRWSLGGEVRSAWLDIHANYYEVPTSPSILDNIATYSSEGYDVRGHVHSPDNSLIAGILGYYMWKGEYGHSDDKGLLLGARITPQQVPLLFEFTYRTGEDSGAGGRFSYTHEFGRSQSSASHVRGSVFRPEDYFYVVAEREYAQKIRKGDGSILAPNIIRVAGLSGVASLRSEGPKFEATPAPELTDVRLSGVSGGMSIAGELRGDLLRESLTVGFPWTLPASETAMLSTEASTTLMLDWGAGGEQAMIDSSSTIMLSERAIEMSGGRVRVQVSESDSDFEVRTNDGVTVIVSGGDTAAVDIRLSVGGGGGISLGGVYRLISDGGSITIVSETDTSVVLEYDMNGVLDTQNINFFSGDLMIMSGTTVTTIGCSDTAIDCSPPMIEITPLSAVTSTPTGECTSEDNFCITLGTGHVAGTQLLTMELTRVSGTTTWEVIALSWPGALVRSGDFGVSDEGVVSVVGFEQVFAALALGAPYVVQVTARNGGQTYTREFQIRVSYII